MSISIIFLDQKPTHKNFRDISGQVFGVVRVIKCAAIQGKNYLWECECKCGEVFLQFQYTLKRKGEDCHCGCLNKGAGYKHGLSGTPEHATWMRMKSRCYNKNSADYKYYGGRGIKVCERWQDAENFIADMGAKPGNEYSIERINVNGDYEPTNCKWATRKEQMRNTRQNRYVTHNGKTMTLIEWAEYSGINYMTLFNRLGDSKWDFERAISTPTMEAFGNVRKVPVSHIDSIKSRKLNGERSVVIAEEYGVSVSAIDRAVRK